MPHSKKRTNFVTVPTEEQITAFIYLLSALCKRYNIPFKVPQDENGNEWPTVFPGVLNDEFQGVCGHYHNSYNRVDPIGVDLVDCVRKASRL